MSGANSTVSDVSTISDNDESASGQVETAKQARTETTDSTDAIEELSVDVVFEVLKNQRRRHVIQYLRDHEGPVELGSMAEHIAALENDKSEAAITYAERKRVYVGLYQSHLPKMDDMDVVDFNRARGRIELTVHVDQLQQYLDAPETERSWYRYYSGITLVGIAMYGTAMGGAASSILSPGLVLLGVLTTVSLCAVCHFAAQRETAD